MWMDVKMYFRFDLKWVKTQQACIDCAIQQLLYKSDMLLVQTEPAFSLTTILILRILTIFRHIIE